ncbi:helix-turn-helix transcriptional regulator [Sphingomonas psychrotolerans]|uniref:Uncharacterized protein n=1 Tax=Sphingomonas psychrotolerans TaxID=1327635 RepID=A0A2K8MER7_9SPHN|nr:hypothetical protein CVN68_10580 [Sphingomonas psychrotolerans]
MQDGTFPSNVKISTRCVRWRGSALAEWQTSHASIAGKRATLQGP